MFATRAARGFQRQVCRGGRRAHRVQGEQGAHAPESNERQRVAERDRGAVAQTGVPVLEVGVLFVTGDKRYLGRGVRYQENPSQVTPQHAPQPPRAVADGADEGHKIAFGSRPGVVPRRLDELPEGPPHGVRPVHVVEVGWLEARAFMNKRHPHKMERYTRIYSYSKKNQPNYTYSFLYGTAI